MKEWNSYEEYESEEMEKTIDKLTLFDDDLMSAVFEHNIEAIELLLRIILKKENACHLREGAGTIKESHTKGKEYHLGYQGHR